MRRSARFSGQLPSPPKSHNGSQSSELSSDTNTTTTRTTSLPPSPMLDRKSRVLRRQSTLNVSGEIRGFFAISPIPTGKEKHRFLADAVDRVSQIWDYGADREPPHKKRKAKDDSDLPTPKSSDDEDKPLKKRWLTSGLYAGSRTTADETKLLAKSRKSDPGPGAGKKFKFTLPIFHGKALFEQRRDFKLPWNLYATTGQKCKPPNWSRIKRSTHPKPPPLCGN